MNFDLEYFDFFVQRDVLGFNETDNLFDLYKNLWAICNHPHSHFNDEVAKPPLNLGK